MQTEVQLPPDTPRPEVTTPTTTLVSGAIATVQPLGKPMPVPSSRLANPEMTPDSALDQLGLEPTLPPRRHMVLLVIESSLTPHVDFATSDYGFSSFCGRMH